MVKLFSLLLMICLAGCAGTNFKWDNVRSVKLGMDKQAVVNVVGAPSRTVAVNTPEGVKETYIWVYADAFSGSKSVSVVFMNGKAISIPPIPDEYKD